MPGTLRASGLRFGTHFCTDAGISWIFVCVKNKTLAPICDVAVTAVSSSIARLMQCSPTSRAAHGDDDARTPSSVSAFPVSGVSVLKTAFKMSVIIYSMTFTAQLCYRGVKTITNSFLLLLRLLLLRLLRLLLRLLQMAGAKQLLTQ